MKDIPTNESTVFDHTVSKGPIFESCSGTNSRIMKTNTSRGTLPSPNKDGNMFGKSDRANIIVGYQNPKIGPGSYSGGMYNQKRTSQHLDRTRVNISQLTSGDNTFGRSDRRLFPQTEKAKRRRFATRFVEHMRQGKKVKPSINPNFEDSSDSENDIPNTPGPGSYYRPSDQSETTRDSTQFQFFGSTSPRFSKTDKNKYPGPGQYKEKVEIPKHAPAVTSVFKGNKKHKTVFEQYISPGPGPGKYKDNRTEFHSKKKYKKRKDRSHFISAERRFLYEPEYIKNPGPGNYFSENDPLALKAPKPQQDAKFGAKSDRNMDKVMVQNADAPMYNLQEYNAIGQKKVN